MVKINRIYTRTGDDGTTGLVGGDRILKDSLQVEAYGEVDELNCWLGVIRTEAVRIKAKRIIAITEQLQNELFDLGAELATPAGKEWPQMKKTAPQAVQHLEHLIDELSGNLPELRSFVLPGGSPMNAALHVARAVCRRAERRVLSLARAERKKVSRLREPIRYLNRLSDLLFAMARYESARTKTPEYLWVPGGGAPTKVQGGVTAQKKRPNRLRRS